MTRFLGRLTLCFFPILLTPLWGYLIADGYLNFGAGEKDLFLLVPWMAWALIYLVIFIIAWIKRRRTNVIILYSAGGATLILAVIWGGLFLWFKEMLGV